ncbi:unnamed protein product (macronuclear) [Paramecium tetraurelia]|uniref:FCP1 homology domain-containing protein n=1 Tax=Paramecium tetraurelia TaxID=5888 RepID=A0CB48_PARTE|nr:uncharacterized protein GSPATT00036798001 [Paramecium tetraurelia]CAK68015.1 unnamed protein product [Paramecium tetraurelia]|eukprot:XP_001435412.1 hypothetical protein (macronuclear) [Paramecium tetraurelia strain d4-2]
MQRVPQYIQRPVIQDSYRQSFKSASDKENYCVQFQKQKPIQAHHHQYQSTQVLQKPEMRPSSSQPRQPSVQAGPRPASASNDKRAFSNQKQPCRSSFKELKNSTYIQPQQATPQSRYFSLKQVPDTNLMKCSSDQQLPNKQIDQQEYKKLHEKLLFLENKINNIKSNIEISNSQLQKQSERSKQKPLGLAAKFFQKKDPEINESKGSISPKELTKCSTSLNLQLNKALKQSQVIKEKDQPSINLDQFITQVKQIKKPILQQQSQLSRHQSLEINQSFNQITKPIINNKSYSSQKPTKDDNFLYYISSVARSIFLQSASKVDEVVRDHIVQTIQGLEYARNLSLEFQQDKVVNLPKTTHLKTIVFDLDETLIHCNESVTVPGDIILPITFPNGEKIQASINIRPYAQQILQTLSRHFEIIVFTASHSCYANIVLDYLDPKKQWISHRLFRDHCIQTDEGAYVKDLRVLGNRKMSNILLIDNASYSFGQQIDNGVPIIAFYDDKQDQELLYLQNYLMKFRVVTDVRELNSQLLKVSSFTNYQDPTKLIQELFPEQIPK